MISFLLSFGKNRQENPKTMDLTQNSYNPVAGDNWHAICRLLSLWLGIKCFLIYFLREKASGREIVSVLMTIVHIR